MVHELSVMAPVYHREVLIVSGHKSDASARLDERTMMLTEHDHQLGQLAFRNPWLRVGLRGWMFPCFVTGCAPSKAPDACHEKVQVAATARILERGSKYSVELTIKNHSSKRGIWLNGGVSETSSSGPLKLRITDGYGHDVPSRSCGTETKHTGAADYVVLSPGEQIRREVALDCYNLADQAAFVVWIYYEDVNTDPPRPPSNADYYWGPLRLGPIPYDKSLEPE